MAYSMTGFGHFEITSEGKKVTCQLKSVNHRYLELSVKMPRKLSVFEGEVRALLKKRISRGKVDVSFQFEESFDRKYDIRYNPSVVEAYQESAIQMAKAYGILNDLTVSSIATLPDVFEVKEAEDDPEQLLSMTMDALDGAIDRFVSNRRDEGERLREDMLSKLDELLKDVSFIESRSPQIIEEYKSRITDRVHELLEDASIDESRIAMEVTLFADKICVDEELVRLRSHIEEARSTLLTDEAVGRKLDFIAQELNREANTILSKSTDKEITGVGIEMKTCIEKIREQIQNLE